MQEVGYIDTVVYAQTYQSIYAQFRCKHILIIQMELTFRFQQPVEAFHKVNVSREERLVKTPVEFFQLLIVYFV